MAGKMEMSLDDIIKENKKNMPRQAGGKGNNNKRDGRASLGSSRKGGAVRSAGSRKPASDSGAGRGVMRGRSRGGITHNHRIGGFGRTSSLVREAFLGPSTVRKFSGGGEATKLIVSNLDFGVTDADILELFREFGPLKRAGVHYDRSGRSLGSADLIFERRSDAIMAMKQYNGVPLDGRELNIQLATSEIPGMNPARTGGFERPSSRSANNRPGAKSNTNHGSAGRRGAAGAGGKSPRRKAAGGKKAPRKVPTAEELDAQLDEYFQSEF